MRKWIAVPWTLLAALSWQAGCNHGHQAEPVQTGTAVVQVTDLPFSDLHSLTLTITRVRLFAAADDTPAEVFPAGGPAASVAVDLVALDGLTALLGSARVPAGEFSAAEITYSGASATAGNPPAPETVSPSAGTIRIDFVEARSVGANRFTPFLLDLDGEASVAPGSGPGVSLTPTVFEVRGDAGSRVAGLRGTVAEVGDSRFIADFDDGTPGGEAIGRLPVILGVNSVMRIDADSFSGPSGLPGIAEGDRAEVSGRLGRDGIEADLVHIDRFHDLQQTATVRLQGTVVGLSPLAIAVEAVPRNPGGAIHAGQTVEVSIDPTATITPDSLTVALGTSSIFVGQEVEVVGPILNQSVTAHLVELRESRVAGTLSAFSASSTTATMAPIEVNGGPATGLLAEVSLSLSSAEGTLGQTSPFDLAGFSAGQRVLATGTFAPPPSNIGPAVFLVSELSLEELQDFEVLPVSADPAAGTFGGTVAGDPVTVVLADSTRLAVRHAGVPDRVFNVGRDEFLDDLARISGPGTVSVRGFLTAGRIEAVRAVMTITPP